MTEICLMVDDIMSATISCSGNIYQHRSLHLSTMEKLVTLLTSMKHIKYVAKMCYYINPCLYLTYCNRHCFRLHCRRDCFVQQMQLKLVAVLVQMWTPSFWRQCSVALASRILKKFFKKHIFHFFLSKMYTIFNHAKCGWEISSIKYSQNIAIYKNSQIQDSMLQDSTAIS